MSVYLIKLVECVFVSISACASIHHKHIPKRIGKEFSSTYLISFKLKTIAKRIIILNSEREGYFPNIFVQPNGRTSHCQKTATIGIRLPESTSEGIRLPESTSDSLDTQLYRLSRAESNFPRLVQTYPSNHIPSFFTPY